MGRGETLVEGSLLPEKLALQLQLLWQWTVDVFLKAKGPSIIHVAKLKNTNSLSMLRIGTPCYYLHCTLHSCQH